MKKPERLSTNGEPNNSGGYFYTDRLFPKKDKSKSKLIDLLDKGYTFCICTITEYEIYSGASSQQNDYWDGFLQRVVILPFDQSAVRKVVDINKALKIRSKQIDKADLFIAAIAMSNNMGVATLNKKHFDRIDGLVLVD